MKNFMIVLVVVVVGAVSGVGGFIYGRATAYSALVEAGLGVFNGHNFELSDRIKRLLGGKREGAILGDAPCCADSAEAAVCCPCGCDVCTCCKTDCPCECECVCSDCACKRD